jgi:hypothetical protein
MFFASRSIALPRALRHLPSAFVAALILGCPSGDGALSGTYEAKSPEGTFTLEFKSGGKVELTMEEPGGKPDTKAADFLVDGNNITIQVPGGMPLTLVKNGKTLDASMIGQILHFEKK